MFIGSCYDNNLKVEFLFSPMHEMLASLHVISKPDHHLGRLTWMEQLSKDKSPKLLENIRKLSPLTNEWCIIMDFPMRESYYELSITDTLRELEQLSLYRWNKVFQQYQISITKDQKSNILSVLKEYYEAIFQYEIIYLQPFLIRILKRELQACVDTGLHVRINKYHERLVVRDNHLIFRKNKEYHFDLEQLHKIVITASTFLSPHLMMHEDNNVIYLTKLVEVEDKKELVPPDLVSLLKALGDETRLKILHEIRKEPCSTQSLAKKLNLTEAGISKHLKLLFEAGLADKKRQGNYINYSLNKDAIDYIPYNLFEFIMR